MRVYMPLDKCVYLHTHTASTFYDRRHIETARILSNLHLTSAFSMRLVENKRRWMEEYFTPVVSSYNVRVSFGRIGTVGGEYIIIMACQVLMTQLDQHI